MLRGGIRRLIGIGGLENDEENMLKEAHGRLTLLFSSWVGFPDNCLTSKWVIRTLYYITSGDMVATPGGVYVPMHVQGSLCGRNYRLNSRHW